MNRDAKNPQQILANQILQCLTNLYMKTKWDLFQVNEAEKINIQTSRY